jgi:tetratricopeptide (TPR) repeat protein
MKYVDHIIRYLSGDLNADENLEFEEQLSSDPALRDEYRQVSEAYSLIREGFRKKDTEAFRQKLRQAMERSPAVTPPEKRRQNPAMLLILSVAASLAILLVILTLTGREDHLFNGFYQPKEDPVILAMSQDSRGNTGTGITLWQREEYAASQHYLGELLEEDPGNRSALLFYLLSSLELGKEEDAIRKVLRQEIGYAHPAERAIAWYTGLAMIRSGRYEEASRYIQPLAEHKGSYDREARKLQGELSK